MQDIRSSNPPKVAGVCDPNKSRVRHHRSLKLGLKLKYLNIFIKKTIDQFCFFAKRTYAHLELRETNKSITFSTVKGTSQLALSVWFCIMNNSAEFQPLPMMEFSFNTLPH